MSRAFPEIADLAETTADHLCQSLPIDPEKVAEEEGLSWRYGSYGPGFDGLLVHRRGKFRIYCNHERGSRRGRFTFAHELGHYLIDEHRTAIVTQELRHFSVGEWHSDATVERQADTFAANLLMPATRFKRLVQNHRAGLAAALAATDSFDVSLTSAALRFMQSTTACCAMVVWRPNGEYSWSWGSDAAYAMGLRQTIRALPIPSDGMATASAMSGHAPRETAFFETVTTASTWFRGVPSRNDIIMREQSIKLGEFGTLTMLVENDS